MRSHKNRLSLCMLFWLLVPTFQTKNLWSQALLASESQSQEKKPQGKEEIKIGILDMQKVITGVDDGKKAQAKLKKEIEGKESYFLNQKQELDRMGKELQQSAALLSAKARTDKQNAFQEKLMKLRNEEMEFQNHIKRLEQEETQKIAVKAASISEKIAKAENIDIVLEPHSSGIVYVKNPQDITDKVIAKFASK